MGLCIGNGLGAHAAEADGGEAGGLQDLMGCEGAENTGNLLALVLQILDPEKARFPGIGKLFEFFGQ